MGKGFSRSGKCGVVLLALAVIGVGVFKPDSQAKTQGSKDGYPRVPGELIVKMRDSGVSAMSAGPLVMQALSGFKVRSLRSAVTDESLKVVRLEDDRDVDSAIERLADEPSIEYAEPNYYVSKLANPDGTPVDTKFKDVWGLNNTGQKDRDSIAMPAQNGTPGVDVGVLKLWQQGITGSRDIVVAVIDTGIDWVHEDLKDNLYVNPGEAGALAKNGRDDDGNGFVDDVHGWNFSLDDKGNPVSSRESSDDEGHGTHVAGTIGAVGDNKIGVAGVNWRVSLMPVKFLSKDGSGTTMGAIEAIKYATKMKVHVMNNSWGGGPYSKALEDAIRGARDQGILFVAAAGNGRQDNDTQPTYPANYNVDNVVSVGAIDNRGQLSVWKSLVQPNPTSPPVVRETGGSHWGATSVDVLAPGTKVLSTVPGDKLCLVHPPEPGKPCDYGPEKYLAFNGISMATPHVSGVAALLLSADRSLTYAQLKERLIKTSVPVHILKSKAVSGGYVNAYNALNQIIPPSIEPDPALWRRVNQVVESPHPYVDRIDVSTTVSYPKAKYLRVHFEKVEVEARYDFVHLRTPSGALIETISGTLNDYTSDYVEGDSMVVQLQSDFSTVGYGFKISWIEVIL